MPSTYVSRFRWRFDASVSIETNSFEPERMGLDGAGIPRSIQLVRWGKTWTTLCRLQRRGHHVFHLPHFYHTFLGVAGFILGLDATSQGLRKAENLASSCNLRIQIYPDPQWSPDMACYSLGLVQRVAVLWGRLWLLALNLTRYVISCAHQHFSKIVQGRRVASKPDVGYLPK